jgi:hypothetical protein
MTLSKLDIAFGMTDDHWRGQYQFGHTKIWDSARCFESGMYLPGQIQCVSFGRTKPLGIGRGGCLLTDNQALYEAASRMRSDGRDLFHFHPWITQPTFEEGYHYWMRPEDCVVGMNMLDNRQFTAQSDEMYNYPDCRTILIKKYKKIEV